MIRLFFKLTEIFGFLLIAASPTLMAAAISAGVYVYNPSKNILIAGCVFTVLGLVLGLLWAYKIKRKKSTVWYLSQVMSSPDMDDQKK